MSVYAEMLAARARSGAVFMPGAPCLDVEDINTPAVEATPAATGGSCCSSKAPDAARSSTPSRSADAAEAAEVAAEELQVTAEGRPELSLVGVEADAAEPKSGGCCSGK